MQAASKIIMFKSSGKLPYRTILEKAPIEPINKSEASLLLEKAINVLDDAEGEWETDHGNPVLREKFHLLRHYLKRLNQA